MNYFNRFLNIELPKFEIQAFVQYVLFFFFTVHIYFYFAHIGIKKEQNTIGKKYNRKKKAKYFRERHSSDLLLF